MKKNPVAFGETRIGTFAPGAIGYLRYSTALKRLRGGTGNAAAMAAEFEWDKEIAAVCVTHGKVADPVIGLVGDNRLRVPVVLRSGDSEGMGGRGRAGEGASGAELPYNSNPLCPFCFSRRPKADEPACCQGWLDVRSWGSPE